MAKYVRIERPGHQIPVKVYKVKSRELAIASLDALAQLRRDDMHAIVYDAIDEKSGVLTALPAQYFVRWATIKEWREGGEA